METEKAGEGKNRIDFGYRKNAEGSFLLLPCEDGEKCDLFAWNMIRKCLVPGLMEPVLETINAKKTLIFRISSCVSFAELAKEGKITLPMLNRFFSSLNFCLRKLREHLLDHRLVLFYPECIFLDPEKELFRFCLYPCYRNEKEDLEEFSEWLVSRINYEDQELVKRAYEFHALIHTGSFHEEALSDLIYKDKPKMEIRQAFETNENKPVFEESILREKPVKQFEESILRETSVKQFEESILPETPVKPDDGGIKRLKGYGNQEGTTIRLSAFPFTIGKYPDRSDYLLHAETVSRMHARIHKEGRVEVIYRIEDLNSLNGTFLNGSRLDPYVKETIHTGDLITFADQEFVFL